MSAMLRQSLAKMPLRNAARAMSSAPSITLPNTGALIGGEWVTPGAPPPLFTCTT